MQVTIDIPTGTAIIMKYDQLNRKERDGKLTPLADIIVNIVEEHYRMSPETVKLINQLKKETKK